MTGEHLKEATDKIGAALISIAEEMGLSNVQLYVAVMYVAGSLGGSVRVPIDDPLTFATFKDGYDGYVAFDERLKTQTQVDLERGDRGR